VSSGAAGRTLAALCAVVGACAAPAGDVGVGDVAPDFRLVDKNTASDFVGQELGPSFFRGEASAWYFGHAN